MLAMFTAAIKTRASSNDELDQLEATSPFWNALDTIMDNVMEIDDPNFEQTYRAELQIIIDHLTEKMNENFELQARLMPECEG